MSVEQAQETIDLAGTTPKRGKWQILPNNAALAEMHAGFKKTGPVSRTGGAGFRDTRRADRGVIWLARDFSMQR